MHFDEFTHNHTCGILFSSGGDSIASNQDAVKKYQAGRDAIMLRPSKEDGMQIRAAAKDAGQSVQAYILKATHDRMEKEKGRED